MEIIHADLHPVRYIHSFKLDLILRGRYQANILIDDQEHVKLIDFGLANFTRSTPATAGTLEGGHKHYMAPEILKLEAECSLSRTPLRFTEASDVFSVAQVCWKVILIHRHLLTLQLLICISGI